MTVLEIMEGVIEVRASAHLPGAHGRTIDVELAVSREEAEELWAPLLERMRVPIRRALHDAGLATSAIDEVLLVGGATRMPCVAQLASLLFGKLPLRALPPDEAVAMGAAVQAALKAGDKALGDLVATDVAPFTIGISAMVQAAGDRVPGVFAPIIDRGTAIPTSRVKRFATVADLPTAVDIKVYQCRRPLWKVCNRAGLRRVGWHVLRHSFGSQLAMNGVSLKAIQELMRLASITMVLRYAHLSPTVRREAVDSLDSGHK